MDNTKASEWFLELLQHSRACPALGLGDWPGHQEGRRYGAATGPCQANWVRQQETVDCDQENIQVTSTSLTVAWKNIQVKSTSTLSLLSQSITIHLNPSYWRLQTELCKTHVYKREEGVSLDRVKSILSGLKLKSYSIYKIVFLLLWFIVRLSVMLRAHRLDWETVQCRTIHLVQHKWIIKMQH